MPRVVQRDGYTEIIGRSGEGVFGLQGHTSNVLVNQSESGCQLKQAVSSNLTNIGVYGKADVGGNHYSLAIVGGNPTLDTIYLSGTVSGTDTMGIWASPAFGGQSTVRNVYVAEYNDNNMYLEASSRGGEAGGDHRVENCYSRDGNISHYRLGGGDELINCVAENTGNVPRHANGGWNSRGLHSFYDGGGRVTARGVHVRVTGQNSGGAGASALDCQTYPWDVSDSEIVGENLVPGNTNFSNTGSNPDTSIPAGVPTTPLEAATGSPSDGVTPPEEAISGGQETITFRTR